MQWTSHDGAASLEFEPPQTTRDYLDGVALALAPLGFNPAAPGGAARLASWCMKHTRSARFDGREVVLSVSAISEMLTLHELQDYGATIARSAGYGDAFIGQARGYLDVITSGGCECRSCAGVDPDDARGCLYAEFDPDVRAAVAVWLPLRDVMTYDMPVWAYQLSAQWRASVEEVKRVAREKAREERERRDKRRRSYEYTKARFAQLGIKW